MSENTTTPKKDIYSYLAVLLFLALFVAGAGSQVMSTKTPTTCGRSALSLRITS